MQAITNTLKFNNKYFLLHIIQFIHLFWGWLGEGGIIFAFWRPIFALKEQNSVENVYSHIIIMLYLLGFHLAP